MTRLSLAFVGFVLAFVGIVWLINLYNFMDGIDGLAGTRAVTVAGTAALLIAGMRVGLLRNPGTAGAGMTGAGADAASLALVSMLLVPASAGFLRWNWPSRADTHGRCRKRLSRVHIRRACRGIRELRCLTPSGVDVAAGGVCGGCHSHPVAPHQARRAVDGSPRDTRVPACGAGRSDSQAGHIGGARHQHHAGRCGDSGVRLAPRLAAGGSDCRCRTRHAQGEGCEGV
ncbi:MAG: hypothetical protein GX492_10290 [Firmicutes bacterium]|nr:hypothetical protein [Bacillota bacterium]